MDVAVSKISSNGQVVIPADIRRRLKIQEGTKFLIIEEGGNLILKPLSEETMEEEFASILATLHAAFDRAGLTPEEARAEVAGHRAEHG